jgi:hypothetical protein
MHHTGFRNKGMRVFNLQVEDHSVAPLAMHRVELDGCKRERL